MNQPPNNPTSEVNIFPNGFLALHSGLQEHLQQGRMTPSMLSVYIALLYQVEWSSGRWNGNAHRVHAGLGGKLSLSQIRKTLAKLEKSGYIRRFKKQGLIGNYFVLINKYRVRSGEVRGKVLNAFESASWDSPKYEAGSDREVTRQSGASETLVTGVCRASDVRLYQEEQDFQESKEDKKSSLPTFQESPKAANRQGRSEGISLARFKRASDKIEGLLSDCLKEKADRRSFPNSSTRSDFRTELETNGTPDMVLAFILFLGRPKSVMGLVDPWKMFIEELPAHLADADAERRKIGDDCESETEMLAELWERVFYETDDTQALLARVKSAMFPAPATSEPEDSGDTSELDAIPELDLSTVPELEAVVVSPANV